MVLAAMPRTLWESLMEKTKGNEEENHAKPKGKMEEKS